MSLFVRPVPISDVRPWLSARNPEAAIRALAHVEAQPTKGHTVLAEVVALLGEPTTSSAAANALRALAPLPPAHLAAVLALARDAAQSNVRLCAASVLGACRERAALPILEPMELAWRPLLEIEPEHPRAQQSLLSDWRAGGIDGTLAFATLPRLGEAIWTATEQDMSNGALIPWLHLRTRLKTEDEARRVVALVRRVVAGTSLADGLTAFRTRGPALRLLARAGAVVPAELGPDLVAAIVDAADTLLTKKTYDLDELGDLMCGVVGLDVDRNRRTRMVSAALSWSAERYPELRAGARSLVGKLVEALRRSADPREETVVEALALWSREPEVGRAVTAWLDDAGQDLDLDDECDEVDRYWFPEQRLLPIGPREPLGVSFVSDAGLREIGSRVLEAYDLLGVASDIDPEPGLEEADRCVDWMIARLVSKTGLHRGYARALEWLVGDVITRMGWRWARQSRSPEEQQLHDALSKSGLPVPPRRFVVAAPDTRTAFDPRAAIDEALMTGARIADYQRDISDASSVGREHPGPRWLTDS
jgi:hypothetical protein